jgi:serine/threonine protein kinase
MPFEAGSTLGPYEIVGALGAGGMGEVYRAHDSRLRRDVAIKVLPAVVADDENRLKRFEQEALATAALNHPNILVVFDVGKHAGTAYVVEELLEGLTLRDLTSTESLPVRKVVDFAIQVANGLAAAHARGIIHRDLKPENLFVTADDRVKILDFGLAKIVEASSSSGASTRLAAGTEPGLVLGTIGYMSPEQVRGVAVDHRADIFSFGAILYELLAGRRAFGGETAADTMTAILKEPPADLAESGRAIPPALARVVDRCLEKNPASRFQSASDLAFALQNVGSDARSGSTMSTVAPVVVEDRRRRLARRSMAAIEKLVHGKAPCDQRKSQLARADHGSLVSIDMPRGNRTRDGKKTRGEGLRRGRRGLRRGVTAQARSLRQFDRH